MKYIMPIMYFDCIDNENAVIELDMDDNTLSVIENGSVCAEATPDRVSNWHRIAKRMGELSSYYNYDGKKSLIFMILLILSVERVSRKLTDVCDAIKSGNKLFKDR